ncbi:hypothetical protein ABZS81_19580 [Streptomyces sp. NPDC005318]|uniref:hypothetical protein n=1 Tax=Streptomyces sp. NPDC005318 TaxID=3157031 RepID=UPI0033A5A026
MRMSPNVYHPSHCVVAFVSLIALLASMATISPYPADTERAPVERVIYTYRFSLGFHPFTSPGAVREQLTDHFWLFPVSGDCRGPLEQGRECTLTGGNPVRVESVGTDWFQIVSLRGHAVGEGLHIRFMFARILGLHVLAVTAWASARTADEAGGLGNKVLAWTLWQILAWTLSVSAYLS